MDATPTLEQARAAGLSGQARAAETAQQAVPDFYPRARTFVVDYLARFGSATGETIVDEARRAGLAPPDDRAFGAVFASLSRQGLIVSMATTEPRRKGHGTSGALRWRLRVLRADDSTGIRLDPVALGMVSELLGVVREARELLGAAAPADWDKRLEGAMRVTSEAAA